MSLADEVAYTHVAAANAGQAGEHRIEVYALSTCAFCEKAIEYLKHRGLAFDYVFVDLIDPDFKRRLKVELKESYGDIPVFPLLVFDRKAAVSGYTPDKYDAILASGSQGA